MRQEITPAFISLVKGITQEAARRIMEVYSSDHRVTIKADESPLTAADLAAHTVIKESLQAITPGIPMVSEEDADQGARLSKCGDQFWLVDPLDGTKEFLSRNGEFTVNIALVADGYPLFGIVAAPALDIVYWGGLDQGAWFENAGGVRALRVNAGTVSRVVASRSHLNEETSAFIANLGEVELVQAGSSLKFCRIAEGAADVYPRLAPTCEWDTAAAQAVLEGAGGFVTNLAGARLRYGKADVLNPHFVAASRRLWDFMEEA